MAKLFLNYINGKFVDSIEKKRGTKISPFTGEILGEYCISEAMDFVLALKDAKKAQIDFSATNFETRKLLLTKLKENILINQDHLALEEALFSGFSKEYVLDNSIKASLIAIDLRIKEIEEQENSELKLVDPVGLVGVVLPWTFAFKELVDCISAAISSGNGLMIKTSSLAPQSAHQIGEILTRVMVPAGLINIFQGTRESIGSFFISHPSLRSTKFIGSYASAEKIVLQAASSKKKYQISAGGKNAAFLLQDFENDNQAQQFFHNLLLGSGQSPLSISRVYILESNLENFWNQAKIFFGELKQIDSPEGVSPWTPLILNERKLEGLKIIENILLEHGKVSAQANQIQSAGCYQAPILIQDLPNCSNFQQDQIRQPVFIVTSVKYSHDMVRWANNSYLSQYAVVFGDKEKAMRLASKIEFSLIGINQWPKSSDSCVGMKQSFFGESDFSSFGSFWSNVKKLAVN